MLHKFYQYHFDDLGLLLQTYHHDLELNYEYPLRAGVGVSDMVASFGELNADTLDLITIANGREMASKIVDLVGFDE